MGYDRKDRQVNQPWVEEEEKLSACVLDISQTLLGNNNLYFGYPRVLWETYLMKLAERFWGRSFKDSKGTFFSSLREVQHFIASHFAMIV